MLTDTLKMSKPPLCCHAQLQFSKANAQTKNYQRVSLPNHTDIVTLDVQATTEKEGRTHNMGLTKVVVQCSADTFMVNQTLVLLINIRG